MTELSIQTVGDRDRLTEVLILRAASYGCVVQGGEWGSKNLQVRTTSSSSLSLFALY